MFGTSKPTLQELLDIRHFFVNGCDFHWSGSGKLPEISLMLFRAYRNQDEACVGCTRHGCPVREAKNPNLDE